MSKKKQTPEERITELEAALEAALESGYSADHWDAVEVVQKQHMEHLDSMYDQQDMLFDEIDYERCYSRLFKHMLESSMTKNEKKIIKNMVATSRFFGVPLQAITHWARDHHPGILKVAARYNVNDVVHFKIIDIAGGEPYLEYLNYIRADDYFPKNSNSE